LRSLRAGSFGEDSEDEQAWDSWLVESDSDSSSDGSGWINVGSDGSNNLEISGSDSEMADGEPSPAMIDQHGQPSARVSSLATTKVRNNPRISCGTQADVPVRYLRQPILR